MLRLTILGLGVIAFGMMACGGRTPLDVLDSQRLPSDGGNGGASGNGGFGGGGGFGAIGGGPTGDGGGGRGGLSEGLTDVLPGINATPRCVRCVNRWCDSAVECSNDPVCKDGVSCSFDKCSNLREGAYFDCTLK